MQHFMSSGDRCFENESEILNDVCQVERVNEILKMVLRSVILNIVARDILAFALICWICFLCRLWGAFAAVVFAGQKQSPELVNLR